MKFIVKAVKGLIIGSCAIAPGISGGALAASLGLYDAITEAVAHPFRDIKSKAVSLSPVILGGIGGALLFSRLIKFLFEAYPFQIKVFFVGLMLGTMPAAIRKADKYGFKRLYYMPFIAAAGVSLTFFFLNANAAGNTSAATPGVPMLFVYGLIIGFGLIVPGVSAAFILIALGSYDYILKAVGNIYITALVPVALGIALSVLLFSKAVDYLLRKRYGYTYYAILGLSLGSVIGIFPGWRTDMTGLAGYALGALGFGLSLYLNKINAEGTQ